MRLAFRESDRQNMDDLARLPLFLPNGQRVDLGAVADFRVARGARTIERTNRLTSVLITGNLDQRRDAQHGTEETWRRSWRSYRMPPGYAWKLGRGFENEDEAGADDAVQSAARHRDDLPRDGGGVRIHASCPVSIITSIFMAIIGVMWFLFVTRTTVTFMALIGVQILIGVVVNIGIVLVAHINDLRAQGMERTGGHRASGPRSPAAHPDDDADGIARTAAAGGPDSVHGSRSAARGRCRQAPPTRRWRARSWEACCSAR